ncbi:MAG: hypothetical protein Athens071416_517 [Parcubacteria group bacterium Athens0714_16]|nr:MAG: hypothetical protein Athens071416_517 [Parcubacteria group bacterium Athens0714_16]
MTTNTKKSATDTMALFEEIRKRDLEEEREFFKTAKVGTEIFWRDPIECPTRKPFIKHQKEKHPGKLVIVDIFPVKYDDKRKLIIISHNGEVIKDKSDGRRSLFIPLWFKLDPHVF